MSETSSPARPASPDQIADAREHWQSLGLSVEAFDQALAGNAPAVPAVPPPPPSSVQAGTMALSEDQAAEMAEALIASGMSPERINAAMVADGFQPTPDATPEQRAQAEHDARWGYGQHPTPESYRIDYQPLIHGDNPPAPEALAEFDGMARSWLAELRLPAELGAGLIERGQQVGAELARMDDASKQLWVREQRYLAERMAGGPDQLAEKIRLAGEVVKQAPGAFWDQAVKAGWFHDAWMIMTLANEGARLQGWKAGRKG